MKGLGVFLIKPLGETYNYKKNDVIVSASVEDASYTNRIGVVVSTPIDYDGDIKEGDKVIVGHNVFRTYYNMQGQKNRSSKYFRDSTYMLSKDEIYMNSRGNSWIGTGDFCAIKPIKNDSVYSIDKYKEVTGIVKVTNKQLDELGVKVGDTVIFKEGGEYEFDINNEKWFIMRSKNIYAINE